MVLASFPRGSRVLVMLLHCRLYGPNVLFGGNQDQPTNQPVDTRIADYFATTHRSAATEAEVRVCPLRAFEGIPYSAPMAIPSCLHASCVKKVSQRDFHGVTCAPMRDSHGTSVVLPWDSHMGLPKGLFVCLIAVITAVVDVGRYPRASNRSACPVYLDGF